MGLLIPHYLGSWKWCRRETDSNGYIST